MSKEDKTLEKYKAYIGETFNRLTILEVKRDEKRGVVCKCKCSCNNEVINRWISAYAVVKGKIKSCGCLQKENHMKALKKYNTYDLSGEYGVGYTSNTDEPFYFDLEDYDKIKDYCWNKHSISTGYQALESYDISTKKVIRFHYLLNKKGWDHINGNSLDNRKENLRKCTHRENNINHAVRSDNTSGTTGVHWSKKRKKWYAEISIKKGKVLNLGFFNNIDDAIQARKEAEGKYYGEWSPLEREMK